MSDPGTRTDWSPLFTPAMLSYETNSDEVAVYRVNDVVRQVVSNQVAVDIVTLTPTSYEVRCYNPQQVTNSTFPNTFSGSPFLTYRVEQGASATSLKITREYRDVSNLTAVVPVARREWMSITRTGTGPTWKSFKWSRTAWTADGQTPVAETSTQSSDTGGGTRSETIATSVDGTGATAAFRLSRSFADIGSGTREVVTSETVGGVSQGVMS